ncbi:MAG: hypothetical protein M3P04_09465 [Actinomycetota bacterium]|nr:hypothetical protein [Actinomycetota bacterium]
MIGRCSAALAVALMGLLTPAAQARPPAFAGSYLLHLLPDPTNYPLDAADLSEGCFGLMPGATFLPPWVDHHVLHVPRSGTLKIELFPDGTFPVGSDWRAQLVDRRGRVVADDTRPLAVPKVLTYRVHGAQKLVVRVCNMAGLPDAGVYYALSR